MSAETWLVIVALAVLAMWVTASLINAVGDRRPRARIVQPPRPPLPSFSQPSARVPWHPEFHLARGRRVRAARCRRSLED
ncbi:hypothetical protein ACQ86D_34005 [Streptomyces galilaeus]